MSIYDQIEASADREAQTRKKQRLAAIAVVVALSAVGLRLWLTRPTPPPPLTAYESIEGVVSAAFDGDTLALTIGTDVAALDEGGLTDAIFGFMEHTGTLEYRVMELRDTAGDLVARGYPEGRVQILD